MIIIKAILLGLFVSQLPIRTDVVVPLYRERPTLARLASELAPVLADLPAATVLLVDDGSGDGSGSAFGNGGVVGDGEAWGKGFV